MTAIWPLLRHLPLAGLALLGPVVGVPALAEEKPIRIGVLYDLSGPFAAAGSVASSIGAQIAIDLTNEKGGVLGKYKVEPVSADSQSKPDVAINEAERLISQEKVNIILGVYSSAHAVPLAAKLESEKKILWITTAVASSVFKNKNLTYAFRAQIHSDQYGEAGAGFLAENAKAKLGQEPKDLKLAIIYEDGPYGTGCGEADDQFSKARGMTQIVLKEAYSASTPDLSSLVTKLKRARPDAILHTGYNPDITLFLRQAREAGLRFKIMIERYKAKTGAKEVPPHVSMGFNQTWILLQNVMPIAIEKHGGTDPEAIRKAALEVDIPPGGTIQGYGVKFFPPGTPMSGQNERSTPVVMQYTKNATTVVWPGNIKTAEPVMPLPTSSPYALA